MSKEILAIIDREVNDPIDSLTVRQLKELLLKIPPSYWDLPVWCSVEAGCSASPVLGLKELRPGKAVILEGY